jgi:hypothetical protein
MQLLKLFFNSNHDVNLRHANSPVIQAAPWSDASIIRSQAPRPIHWKTSPGFTAIHGNSPTQIIASRHVNYAHGVP